jgi:hypothetical protein
MLEDCKYQLPTGFCVKDEDEEDKVNIRPIEGGLLCKGISETVKTPKKQRKKQKKRGRGKIEAQIFFFQHNRQTE